MHGYVNRLRSSCRLAQAAHRHVEVIGLVRHLRPDVNTLADVRHDHITAFKPGCRPFTRLCQAWELFGGALLAIDGRQFTAVHRTPRHGTKAKRPEARPPIDASLEHDLHARQTTDQEAAAVPQPTAAARRENSGPWNAHQGPDAGLQAAMAARGERPVSWTDLDSRTRPKSPPVDGGDNAPVAVDATQHRRGAHEVTTASTDGERLRRLARQAQAALGVAPVTVVAAMGDSHGAASNAGEDAGIAPSAAKPWTATQRALGRYGQARVRDAPAHDDDRCPAGPLLTVRCAPVERGRHRRDDATTAGRRCQLQAQWLRH